MSWTASEVAQLLWARFAPGDADAGRNEELRLDLPARLSDLSDPEQAEAHAVELRRALCPEAIDLRERERHADRRAR